ncbi:MAG: XRE family transcriptional regulator [Micrococcus sp.]|nr:XRE family transcriptional regulator [Micrococcus sp.]
MKALPLEPEATDPKIGARLRSARERRRLTIAQLAEATSLSKGFLSRVERDLTSPSVATLVTLCQALGVSPGVILDAPELAVVHWDHAPSVSLGGEGIEERLMTPRGRRDLQIIRAEIAPGGRGEPELYTVDCAVEAVHVVTGCLELVTTHQTHTLHDGDTITFAGQEPHTWINAGSTVAVVLWTLAGGH